MFIPSYAFVGEAYRNAKKSGGFFDDSWEEGNPVLQNNSQRDSEVTAEIKALPDVQAFGNVLLYGGISC